MYPEHPLTLHNGSVETVISLEAETTTVTITTINHCNSDNTNFHECMHNNRCRITCDTSRYIPCLPTPEMPLLA